MCQDIRIDGSQGEGGGQILRSSLALSMITQKPVTIENIRAGREKPGLMRQHLTAVQAAAAVCQARVDGAEIGSRTLRFEPGATRAGRHSFSVGTAGSATLVLQTVLPALLIADDPSELTLEGGTHNPWAPPFDFLQRAFLPLINRMGPKVTARLEKHGFYPVGGGRFVVSVEPSPALRGFHLLERGDVKSRSVCALVANLPRHIGSREADKIVQMMNWRDCEVRVEEITAQGPGNAVFAELESEHITEIFTGFGRVGISAENVANEVVRGVRGYVVSTAPVGRHLADQILLPLGISAWQSEDEDRLRGGIFRTLPLTRHASTQIEIMRQFLEIDIHVLPDSSEEAVTVQIRAT